MEIGIGVGGGRGQELAEWIDKIHLAEQLGYSVLGVGDSQSINLDVYVELAVLARETTAPRLTPMVTNPLTRHPTVTAGAIASIDHVSGGRAILGFGRGNNAPKNIGLARANTQYMRDYITCLRELLNGRHTMWEGHDIHAHWVSRPVPIFLSAYGPVTMRMAGELADGVIICCGIHPEIIAENIALVHEGAKSAGRDPAEIEVWVMTRGSVRDDHDEAITDVKANIASGALMIPLDDHVPDDLKAACRQVRQEYQYPQHVVAQGVNAELVDRLGLTDYLVDRLSIAGTPTECRQKLAAIADLGIDVLYFAGAIRDPMNMVRRLATDV
jgi:5,10-methylenetetrahydromethanopterin reductase